MKTHNKKMKKLKLFYTFIIISGIGASMVAKSAGEEPNSEKEALLNELPKYIEKVEKMWVHLTNIAEDYDALETKFNEIQNVPQFDKAIFEKEWEETFSEEKNKIDRSLSIGIGQIDKGIADIDASNKRNIDLFHNLEKNTEKEIDDIKKNKSGMLIGNYNDFISKLK